jgi:hypothetical protein
MSLKFEKNSEAFLSVLTLVVGADQVGSLAERDFLFQKVKGISIFGNPSPADFSKLLGQVTDAVYSKLPQKDGVVTAAGVDALLSEVKSALSPELRKTLIETATELGSADGTDARETELIDKIRRALC